VRFQPRLGRYLAAAAENIVSILDVETQACRYSLKVGLHNFYTYFFIRGKTFAFNERFWSSS
jgi:hypothetical protein